MAPRFLPMSRQGRWEQAWAVTIRADSDRAAWRDRTRRDAFRRVAVVVEKTGSADAYVGVDVMKYELRMRRLLRSVGR